MEEENNNDEVLSDDLELSSADDKSTVGNIAKIMGETLGKEFPDDETALKSIKDTFAYVSKAGKAMKTVEKLGIDLDKDDSLEATPPPKTPEIDTDNFIDKATYLKDTFYAKFPEYAGHQELIDSYVRDKGISHTEAVSSEALKPLFEKTSAYDEIQSKKSVLETNPRLGAITDKMTKARQDLSEGNDVAAKAGAVSSVMDIVKE